MPTFNKRSITLLPTYNKRSKCNIMQTASKVNRKTEKQEQAHQRSIQKRNSRKWRKDHPKAKRRAYFPHKAVRRRRFVYNMFAKARYKQFGPKTYTSTLPQMIKRLKGVLGISKLSKNSMRGMLQDLEDAGLIRKYFAFGVWNITCLKPCPTQPQLRSEYLKTVSNINMGQVLVGGGTLTHYIYCIKKLSNYNTTKEGRYYTYAGGTMDDRWNSEKDNEILSAEKDYQDFLRDPQAMRKLGINTYRKKDGMTLLPEGKPIGRKKTESEMARRREYAQTNASVAPTIEYVISKSEEERQAEMDAIHTPENDARAEAFFEEQARLRGYSRN